MSKFVKYYEDLLDKYDKDPQVANNTIPYFPFTEGVSFGMGLEMASLMTLMRYIELPIKFTNIFDESILITPFKENDHIDILFKKGKLEKNEDILESQLLWFKGKLLYDFCDFNPNCLYNLLESEYYAKVLLNIGKNGKEKGSKFSFRYIKNIYEIPFCFQTPKPQKNSPNPDCSQSYQVFLLCEAPIFVDKLPLLIPQVQHQFGDTEITEEGIPNGFYVLRWVLRCKNCRYALTLINGQEFITLMNGSILKDNIDWPVVCFGYSRKNTLSRIESRFMKKTISKSMDYFSRKSYLYNENMTVAMIFGKIPIIHTQIQSYIDSLSSFNTYFITHHDENPINRYYIQSIYQETNPKYHDSHQIQYSNCIASIHLFTTLFFRSIKLDFKKDFFSLFLYMVKGFFDFPKEKGLSSHQGIIWFYVHELWIHIKNKLDNDSTYDYNNNEDFKFCESVFLNTSIDQNAIFRSIKYNFGKVSIARTLLRFEKTLIILLRGKRYEAVSINPKVNPLANTQIKLNLSFKELY